MTDRNRLGVLRGRAGMTQKEVAGRMGISPSAVAKHESGDRGLTPEEIRGYADLYGVPSQAVFVDPEETDHQFHAARDRIRAGAAGRRAVAAHA